MSENKAFSLRLCERKIRKVTNDFEKVRKTYWQCSNQGSSQPHSPGWARVPLSSLFPQISINFSYFSSNFTSFLPHLIRPPGNSLAMPLVRMLHGWWIMQNALLVSIVMCLNINWMIQWKPFWNDLAGNPSVARMCLCSHSSNVVVELVKVTYSRYCLSFSADKIMRGTPFQSQPMKVWFPASSSAFSSLFFI